MTTTDTLRITPRLIVGFFILALGALWTLDNLDLIESEPFTRWWPLVLILIGAVQLLNPRARKIWPFVLILVGVLFLLDEFRYVDFDLGDLFPLLIAVVGAKLIWDAVRRRPAVPPSTDDPDATIHAFAMMAGVKRQSTSHDFRGGSANAFMGGVELDLRNAQVKDGQVLIDAFAMWGGVDIFVPSNWRVVGDVLPIMGGFEDNTKPTGEGGPILNVRGTAIMGAIEVKN
jgi:predicted membrane protein